MNQEIRQIIQSLDQHERDIIDALIIKPRNLEELYSEFCGVDIEEDLAKLEKLGLVAVQGEATNYHIYYSVDIYPEVYYYCGGRISEYYEEVGTN